jgi:hypothetical protein
MTTSPNTLYPEATPGGSLIGSVNSRFAAAVISPNVSIYYSPPKPTSLNPSEENHSKPRVDIGTQTPYSEAFAIIENLPRADMEALVTRAWMHTIHDQSEDNLRSLLLGAVNHKLLSEDDLRNTCSNSFSRLPTKVSLLAVLM